jgi:hypothetical protein
MLNKILFAVILAHSIVVGAEFFTGADIQGKQTTEETRMTSVRG